MEHIEEIAPFLMVVCIVIVICLTVIAQSFIIKMARIKQESLKAAPASAEKNTEVLARLDKLERRMSNLETIVLESEKHRQFERTL